MMKNMIQDTNYTLYTDFYEINMAYIYFKENMHEKKAIFDVFYRKNPFDGGYCVFMGLEKIINIINNWHFSDEQINYLRTLNNYDEDFLNYLKNIKFSGNIFSMQEGEIIFANEPIMRIEANIIEAILLETIILNILNYQVLIATKASKIVSVTNKQLIDFSARRSMETEASLWGNRASYIVGFSATSLLEAGKKFNIPVIGTHAHSFVQAFVDEKKAFATYAKYMDKNSFLVDTYNIKTGIDNAIDLIKEQKINVDSVRIDSGDLAKYAKYIRKKLDDNNLNKIKIIASNDIDENAILDLEAQNAPIDIYGIGTKLASCSGCESIGIVYKMVNFNECDVIKISNSKDKISIPGIKNIYRIKNDNKAQFDLITLHQLNNKNDEVIINQKLLEKENIKINEYRELLKQIYANGKLIYKIPSVDEIKKFHFDVKKEFNNEILRYKKPEEYQVYINEEIYDLRKKLIKERS